MEKKQKQDSMPLSHYARCKRGSILPTPDIQPRTVRLQYTREYDNRIHKVVKQCKTVEVDRYEEMKKYKVSDFSLENLQAIGAELKPVVVSQSRFTTIDNLENNMSNIINNSNNE